MTLKKAATNREQHLTPAKAVRLHCVNCCNGNTAEPAHCSANACPLWPHRYGRRPTQEDLNAASEIDLYPRERGQKGKYVAERSALKSIKARCIDCAGSAQAARECTATGCELHPYRLGRGNKALSAEQRQQTSARLIAARWGRR